MRINRGCTCYVSMISGLKVRNQANCLFYSVTCCAARDVENTNHLSACPCLAGRMHDVPLLFVMARQGEIHPLRGREKPGIQSPLRHRQGYLPRSARCSCTAPSFSGFDLAPGSTPAQPQAIAPGISFSIGLEKTSELNSSRVAG